MKADQRCPKCGGVSWYERFENDIVQKCLCGLHRFVYEEKDGILIKRKLKVNKVALPHKDSKLFATLAVLAAYYPQQMNTRDISNVTGHTVTETASELLVLDHKGLVERLEERRGIPGGSIWILSHSGCKLLKVR
jgi:predicted Rossmann fold nucleotide-binding protein DprA/Smf involved in DNA uptake